MYIQQTTHSYGPLSMPMFVKPSDDGRTVTVRWGVGGDVHLSLSPDEAERLRDGLTAALAELAERVPVTRGSYSQAGLQAVIGRQGGAR